MKRVALRGLAARPVRTALTMLAIVLGVAMVSGAFTLTDTMRGAADSLSSSAYDGTDAVVSAKTAFKIDATDWTAKRPTVDAKVLERVRSVPQVAIAVGDITDEAKIVGRDGKPVGDGPYFGSGYDSRTAGAQATTPFRLDSGRWATAPDEVVIDAATAENAALRGRLPRPHHHAGRGAPVHRRGHRPLRQREVARHGDRRRVRPRARRSRCSTRAPATTRSSSPGATASPAPTSARPSPPRSAPRAQVQTAARPRPLHARGPRAVHLDHPDRAARVRRSSRSSSARSRSSTRSRSRSPSGRASSGCCGWSARRAGRSSARCCSRRWRSACSPRPSASRVGFGVAMGLDAIFDSMDISLPDAGMVFGSQHGDRVDARRHARDAGRAA